MQLGDFTVDRRLLFISSLAFVTGIMGACLAYLLLKLIALSTNLFFFQRFSTDTVIPRNAHVGILVVPIAVSGATIVGIMARYGSDKIRGHGIPEAIEAILINGSRVAPKVALLKPISAAISIGSGGPFGAEGPIIMTGGSFGSLLAQGFHVTDNERKTLLVAGAAAGMTGIFATPLAAILLAVELLLFEWKPRSLIPVCISSVASMTMRHYLIDDGPLFAVAKHAYFVGPVSLVLCAVVGLSAGVLALILTNMVYKSEDTFGRLPFHWMWWPVLGGLVIGIGGLIVPRTLGVGYDVIGDNLNGALTLKIALSVLLVKGVIWSVSLGSGTSGGVVAPLLMMGTCLGAVWAEVLPDNGPGFWPLIGMAAVMGSTMGCPLTAIVFSVELTHDQSMIVPLICGVAVAYAFTVLVMKRSILTEKISRRGYHLSREYEVDPLELTLVRDFLEPDFLMVPPDTTGAILQTLLNGRRPQPVLVVDTSGKLVSTLGLREIETLLANGDTAATVAAGAAHVPTAYLNEPLRAVVHRMAASGRTRLPVVDPRTGTPAGIITLEHMLLARNLSARSDTDRRRVFTFPWGRAPKEGS